MYFYCFTSSSSLGLDNISCQHSASLEISLEWHILQGMGCFRNPAWREIRGLLYLMSALEWGRGSGKSRRQLREVARIWWRQSDLGLKNQKMWRTSYMKAPQSRHSIWNGRLAPSTSITGCGQRLQANFLTSHGKFILLTDADTAIHERNFIRQTWRSW